MPDDLQRDGELMIRLGGGDSAALEELIERWQRPLLSFIYRYIQDAEAAQELTQETFIRLYRARERFDPRHRFSGWLFRIAANLCRNHLRWRRRRAEVPLEAEQESIRNVPERLRENGHPAQLAARQDEVDALRAAVARMPHALKTALLLHYYEGLSYREIGTALGCSERGVESRLYRARKWLAQRLEGMDRPASAPISNASAGGANDLSVQSRNLLV